MLALYPGTFDPITNGHLDVLARAAKLVDALEVTVAVNAEKKTLFSADERVALIQQCAADIGLTNVTVATFEGLIADYARQRGATALVRGLRQVSDFDYEFRMAFANRRLNPALETVYLMTGEDHAMISSSIVRDVHRWGGDVGLFVPPPVVEALQRKSIR